MLIFFKNFLLFFVTSNLVLALGVNDEVELTQIMNARHSANFTRYAKNLMGQMNAGTKAKVLEVKKFNTGNSGFLLEVKDGNLRNQKVWVHFNPKQPSLKLFNAQQQPVVQPDLATDAIARKDTPVILDPIVPPTRDLTLIPIPNSVVSSTSPTTHTSAIPDLVAAANGAVANTGASAGAGCRDCATTGQAGVSAPVVDTVAATAPRRGVVLDISPDRSVRHAEINCQHRGEYKSFAGSFKLKIENNRVVFFESIVDEGRCVVSSRTFTQVNMGNNNIVLRNPAGCSVALNANGESVRRGDALVSQTPTPQNAVMNFGVILIEGGPCEAICPKAREGRKFWQVTANPRSGNCQ